MVRLNSWKAMNNPTEKKCTKCGEVKILSMFGKNKYFKDGYNLYCKLCVNNSESRKLACKKYREKNRESIRIKDAEYRNNNKDLINERNRKRNELNKDVINKKQRDYRLKNDNSSQYNKRNSKQLTDTYIRSVLRLSMFECPKELIELKRAQLQLYRATH